jgi:hypothetical protein
MKVLLLTHPEADYGEYNGLCKVLGAENVWDVPFKKSYHGQIHTYPGYYNGKLAPPSWGLGGGGSTGVTAPFEWAQPRDVPEHGEAEVFDELARGGFEAVVVGSPRAECRRHLAYLRERGARLDRLVLHDGEDHQTLHRGLVQEYGIKLYLKREMQQNLWMHGARLVPFPFSAALHHPETVEKSIDVLCAVGATNPVRGAVKAAVEEMSNVKVLAGHWGYARYIELIATSRIAIAPHGHGQDTVRRWEVPAFDTLMLCQKLTLAEENPLVDGEHCSYYSSVSELTEKVRWWLTHEEDRERVARAGREFVRQHHSNEARARRMLELVREVYN